MAFLITICFHTFKALLLLGTKKSYGSSVMEYRSSRIQNNIMVRNDVRSIPAFPSIIYLQHVIRHVLSKAKLFISDLRLWVLGALKNNIALLYIITEL